MEVSFFVLEPESLLDETDRTLLDPVAESREIHEFNVARSVIGMNAPVCHHLSGLVHVHLLRSLEEPELAEYRRNPLLFRAKQQNYHKEMGKLT